jgi:Response regulator containing a CheY-like receiver domain and an HTH DNA-binding domain
MPRGEFEPGTSRARILLVEDNAELAAYLAQGLSSGHRVVAAKDGLEAMERLGKERFGLVLTDLMMDRMDGLEPFRRAKKGGAATPFLFLTAKADESAKLEALDEGAIDYIVKPFDELALYWKIDNIIALSRASALRRTVEDADLPSRLISHGEEYGLSKRELEVSMLLFRGRSKKEIAAELGIATATVKRHVESLYAKCGAQDRFQLFALMEGRD